MISTKLSTKSLKPKTKPLPRKQKQFKFFGQHLEFTYFNKGFKLKEMINLKTNYSSLV